ncbi:MAG: DUF2706 domain-containing protein [Rickettsiaceae bacterium]
MKSYCNIFIVSLLLLSILSCTPRPPYEIKSPCVANEVHEGGYTITPCVRRPVNVLHDIA